MANSARQSWLDDESKTSLIDEYTQRLTSFVDAIADGHIDDHELATQEKRLTAAMTEIEPTLDDATHAKVTRLLCEMTAYNVMQTLYSLQANRPKTAFHG